MIKMICAGELKDYFAKRKMRPEILTEVYEAIDIMPAIVAEDMASVKNAVNKQIPMSHILRAVCKDEKGFELNARFCPVCNEMLGEPKYCPNCGQKMEWC